MYTYTQRRDVLSYECFAGRVMADGRVYIGEAGTDDSCRRRIDPTRMGMLINKIGKNRLKSLTAKEKVVKLEFAKSLLDLRTASSG